MDMETLRIKEQVNKFSNLNRDRGFIVLIWQKIQHDVFIRFRVFNRLISRLSDTWTRGFTLQNPCLAFRLFVWFTNTPVLSWFLQDHRRAATGLYGISHKRDQHVMQALVIGEANKFSSLSRNKCGRDLKFTWLSKDYSVIISKLFFYLVYIEFM